MSTSIDLDGIDRRILQALQADGRATFDQLAGVVGLSPSATLRRVKRLEEAKVIAGYVALVAPEAVGLGLMAYLNVRLEKRSASQQRTPVELFRAAVQAWPEVADCAALSGEMDYLLRIAVADMAAFDTLYKRLTDAVPIKNVTSHFAMERMKFTTAYPVDTRNR